MLSSFIAALLKRIADILYLYSWLIVLNTALTLFTRVKDMNKDNYIKNLLKKLTDPVNNVFRYILRTLGWYAMPLDLSPMLSIIAVWVVQALLLKLSALFAGMP